MKAAQTLLFVVLAIPVLCSAMALGSSKSFSERKRQTIDLEGGPTFLLVENGKEASVTVLKSGDIIVVYGRELPGGGEEVYMKRFDKTAQQLLDETNLAPDTANEPFVIALSDGGYLASWESTPTTSPTTLRDVYKRYDEEGNEYEWNEPLPPNFSVTTNQFRLSENHGARVNRPRSIALHNPFDFEVYSDFNEGAFLSWWLAEAPLYTFMGRSYPGDGEDFTPIFNITGNLDNDNMRTECVIPAGTNVNVIHCVYSIIEEDGDNKLVLQSFNPNFSPLGSPRELEGREGARKAALATLANGKWVVAYEDKDAEQAGERDVMIQLFDRDGSALITPREANTIRDKSQTGVSVGALKHGGFVVAWESQTDTLQDVHLQVFDNEGTALLDEDLLVNDNHLLGAQNGPKVISLSTGDFMVTWKNGSDGDNHAVSARIFSDPCILGCDDSSSTDSTHSTSDSSNQASNSDSSSSSAVAAEKRGEDSDNTGVIVGVTIPLVVVLLCVIVAGVVLGIILRRKRKKKAASAMMSPTNEVYAHSTRNLTALCPKDDLKTSTKETEKEKAKGKEKDEEAEKNEQSTVVEETASADDLENPIAGTSCDILEIPEEEVTYLDKKPVASGTFGTIFKGFWKGKKCAVKVSSSVVLDEDIKEEFRREALIMHQLGGKKNHCVTLFGVMSRGERLCLVTEWAKYGSAYDLLIHPKTKKTDIPWELVVRIARDTARGLRYLHSMNMVHRDVAARNVLVCKHYKAVVGDFGLSRVLQKLYQTTRSDLGPVKWMAPEAIRHRKYSRATDSFSFGVFLWELCTRQEPWSGTDALGTAMAVVEQGKRLPIRENEDDVMKKLMTKCWAEDPADRPIFQELCSTLEDYYKALKEEASHGSQSNVVHGYVLPSFDSEASSSFNN